MKELLHVGILEPIAHPNHHHQHYTMKPFEMTGLLLISLLELVGVFEDLSVFRGEKVDVVLVDLKLLQGVDQLHLLRQQQLVLQLRVDQAGGGGGG